MSEYKDIVLQFSASFCGSCQQAKRYIKGLNAEDKIVYVDIEDNEALVSEYKIRNLPTFIKLDVDGKEIERFVGFDKAKIDKLLED